jgi:hypothetical protein
MFSKIPIRPSTRFRLWCERYRAAILTGVTVSALTWAAASICAAVALDRERDRTAEVMQRLCVETERANRAQAVIDKEAQRGEELAARESAATDLGRALQMLHEGRPVGGGPEW